MKKNHRVTFAIMVPLISIMLFSSTILPGLPSVIPPSPSVLPIQEVFAQDTDEEEPESRSSEESTDEPTDEPTDGSTDITCPDGQVLEDGECVDPPEPPTCPDGQVLEDGECVDPPEPPTCPDGQVLEDGECRTPAPTPAPTPTNPGGVIQQPSAAPPNSCEVWNIDGQGQTESTSTAAPPTGTCPKIEVILSTNNIKPEIGQVRFGSIIPVPGAPQTHTQPRIDGGTVDITVRVTGLPDNSNIPVTLDFKPQRPTGGHSHISGGADDTTKRAFGRFIGPGVDNNNPLKITGKTDSSGELKVTFRAENLLSDYSSASGILEFTATATLQGQSIVSSPKTLTIEIPGLQSLPGGNNYITYGDSTQNHGGNNHYGIRGAIAAIQNIANEYARTHNGDRLQIGQISLPMGGVFDISGDWNPAGQNDGHKSHACGTDVDVDDLASNGRSINSTDLAMITIRQYAGAFVISEGSHYHIHFGDCAIADPECAPEEVKKARQFFDKYMNEFTYQTWTVAYSNLRDFVEGKGGNPKQINPDWVRRFNDPLSAEKRIQQYFESGAKGAKDKGLTEIALLSVEDGKTVKYPSSGNILWQAGIGVGSYKLEWFWAIGHGTLYGNGAFEMTRQGDIVKITGIVNFRMYDVYDFNKGQPGHAEAEILKKCADAKDYTIESYWTKVVSGTVNVKTGSAQYTWTLL
jgi:hypothetical protein